MIRFESESAPLVYRCEPQGRILLHNFLHVGSSDYISIPMLPGGKKAGEFADLALTIWSDFSNISKSPKSIISG